MARSFHVLDRLPPPFELIDERVIFIPPGATVVTRNQHFKCVFFFEGEMRMEISGGKEHYIEAGDIMVVPGACVQEYFPTHPQTETRLHVARLLFDPNFRCDRRGARTKGTKSIVPEGWEELVRILSETFTEVTRISGLMEGEMTDRLAGIFQEIENREPGYPFAVHGELLSLVMELIRHKRQSIRTRMPPEGGRMVAIVRQTKAYLRENFDRELLLRDVAWHLRLSEEHLARIFRQETGDTVASTIRRMRIDKARRLLLSSNETMTAIARACGFRSLSVFSVNFKKQTGTSPAVYRKLHTPEITYPKSNLRWKASADSDG